MKWLGQGTRKAGISLMIPKQNRTRLGFQEERMREKLVEMLKVHEGVETHAYKCSASKITVGVGRNIDPEGGIGLSDDEVDYLLQNDIDRVVS